MYIYIYPLCPPLSLSLSHFYSLSHSHFLSLYPSLSSLIFLFLSVAFPSLGGGSLALATTRRPPRARERAHDALQWHPKSPSPSGTTVPRARGRLYYDYLYMRNHGRAKPHAWGLGSYSSRNQVTEPHITIFQLGDIKGPTPDEFKVFRAPAISRRPASSIPDFRTAES